MLHAGGGHHAALLGDEGHRNISPTGSAEHGPRVPVQARRDIDAQLRPGGAIEALDPSARGIAEITIEAGAEEGVDPDRLGSPLTARPFTDHDARPGALQDLEL